MSTQIYGKCRDSEIAPTETLGFVGGNSDSRLRRDSQFESGYSSRTVGTKCVDVTLAVPVDQPTQADLLYAISLFGSLVHNSELYERKIPEELMRESKFYERQVEINYQKDYHQTHLDTIEIGIPGRSGECPNAITSEHYRFATT